MPGPVAGMFFYLYLIVDIFSRKIVGWEVHEREAAELAAILIEKAVWAEACIARPVVLHADNGSPMKGATMKVTLEKTGHLGILQPPAGQQRQPILRGAVPHLQVSPASIARTGKARALQQKPMLKPG